MTTTGSKEASHLVNIDCHAHFIPPAVLEAAKASTDIEVAGGGSGTVRFRFPRLPWSSPAQMGITDKDCFLAWQAEQGLDVQVLSCWTDLLGYTLEAPAADAWCAAVNEALAAEVDGTESLEAMGVVPLTQPARCAHHLDRIMELGLRGVVIGTSTPELALDSPGLTPFWAAAEERGLAVLVHPIFLSADPALAGPGLANAVGRSNATNVAMSRLLLGGVLHRHPDLRLVVSHGGGGLALLLGRLERNYQLHDGYSYSIREGFARLYFDSVVCDPTALTMLLQVARPEQLLLGSDYPFPWEPHPVRTVLAANLGEEATRLICDTTPRRLYGLANSGAVQPAPDRLGGD